MPFANQTAFRSRGNPFYDKVFWRSISGIAKRSLGKRASHSRRGVGVACPGPGSEGRSRHSRFSHIGKAPAKAIRAPARALFPPKYSPDLNSLEQVLAKLATMLREAGARSVEALFDVIAKILVEYT